MENNEVNRAKQNLFWFCRSIERQFNLYKDEIDDLHLATDAPEFKMDNRDLIRMLEKINFMLADFETSKQNLLFLLNNSDNAA